MFWHHEIVDKGRQVNWFFFLTRADLSVSMCKPDYEFMGLYNKSFNLTAKTTLMCGNCCVVKGTISVSERLLSAPCFRVNT